MVRHMADTNENRGPWGRLASFARDVAVNVAGNLVTAAMIWITLQAAGLVARNPAVSLLAVQTVGTYLLLIIVIYAERVIQRLQVRGTLTVRAALIARRVVVYVALLGLVLVLIFNAKDASQILDRLAEFV